MKKKGVSFKFIYWNYFATLVLLVLLALFYVSKVLEDYENSGPDGLPELAMMHLGADSLDNRFWIKYDLPTIEATRLEKDISVNERYKAQFQGGEFEYIPKKTESDSGKLVYIARLDGVDLAEITLRATSEMKTKLAILTYQDWEIESAVPIFEKREYSLTVPSDFVVKINGIQLNEEEIVSFTSEETSYKTGGLYLKPEVEIKDAKGNSVSYQIVDGQIVAEFYYYTLTLPSVLTVELNGQKLVGETTQEGPVVYEIRELKKPEVIIKDCFGNQFAYEGGNEIPLSYWNVEVDSRYSVLVNGVNAPMDVVTVRDNPEFAMLKEYVEDLPQIHHYEIAVLQPNTQLQVVDQNHMAIEMEEDRKSYNFVGQAGVCQEVPTAVASQVDALAIAQEWSLFMSNDRSFDDIKGYMVKDSYQYEVTKKYAGSVDRKFFSSHTLRDPAFTEESVSNFTWITDKCFSVDISFIKHMALKSGRKVDDTMNDRFYFLLWDDSQDEVENPTWKIVSMKEIVSDAE